MSVHLICMANKLYFSCILYSEKFEYGIIALVLKEYCIAKAKSRADPGQPKVK